VVALIVMGSGVDKLALARISDFVNLSAMTKSPENLPLSFRRSSIRETICFSVTGLNREARQSPCGVTKSAVE
jgi:hypothetical protein